VGLGSWELQQFFGAIVLLLKLPQTPLYAIIPSSTSMAGSSISQVEHKQAVIYSTASKSFPFPLVTQLPLTIV
jgi:hypothetical protein